MTPAVMEDAVLLDAVVPLLALGEDGEPRRACRRYLADLATGRGRGYASTEMIQEVVFHRLRRTGNPRLAASEGRALMSALTILKFDYEVLNTSLGLVEQLPSIRGRSAVHAATALAYGIPTIASNDAGFDLVPGLIRVNPVTADAKLSSSTPNHLKGSPQP